MTGTKDWIFSIPYGRSRSPREYYPRAGETIFADPIHLFKADLKISSPSDESELDMSFFTPEFRWQAYPDAAFYEITFYIGDPDARDSVGRGLAAPKRVDGTSYPASEKLREGNHYGRLKPLTLPRSRSPKAMF